MSWTQVHNIALVKEVMAARLHRYKIGTRERGNCWDRIASKLNTLEKPYFKVDQRAVRDHTSKLIRDFKRKVVKREASTGFVPEMTNLDDMLEPLIDRMEGKWEDSEQNEEDGMKNIKGEETEGGSSRWEMDSIDGSSGTDTEFVLDGAKKKKAKLSRDFELRKLELELKEKEITVKEMEQQQKFELRRRELDLKEREQENKRQEDLARQEKESKLINLIQQQQLICSQFYQQNQSLLKSLTEK